MKVFDAEKFLREYNIDHSHDDKNVSVGWVGVPCPFCNDHSYHGGFNLSTGYYNCWRCSGGTIKAVIQALTGLSAHEATRIQQTYIKKTARNAPGRPKQTESDPNKIKHLESILGHFSPTLDGIYEQYLIQRNFDPDELVKKYDLRAAGHIGPYKWRIIAPIYLNGGLISFQGRDVSNKQKIKYKACRMKDEVLHHKQTLYAIDRVKNDSVIFVEGITDVWRLGDGAIATFGIEFKSEQVLMIAKRFKNAFILFDSDEQAQKQAEKLGMMLNSLRTSTEIIELYKGDPA